MADPRERWNDLEESTRIAVDRHLGTVWTALPVRVMEDSEGHVCKLQPTIKGEQRGRDGNMEPVEITNLGAHVPIHFAAGGGFTITHPVTKDDEGMAVFQSRCIDGWWDKGGIQAEPYRRRHHLADAMYIPGFRNKPRQLGGNPDEAQHQASNGEQKTAPPSTTTLQIRTDKGDVYVEVTEKGINIITPKDTGPVTVVCHDCTITAAEKVHIETKTMEVKATDKVSFDTPLIETTGKIEAQGDITAGNISLEHHVHINSGGPNDGGPPRG